MDKKSPRAALTAAYISEEQAAELRSLITTLAEMERSYLAEPSEQTPLRELLERTLGIASYERIPHDRFDEAKACLERRIALVRLDCERPADVARKRQAVYGACHAIAARCNAYPLMRLLMQNQWRAESMRELSDLDLHDLHIFMRALAELKKRV